MMVLNRLAILVFTYLISSFIIHFGCCGKFRRCKTDRDCLSGSCDWNRCSCMTTAKCRDTEFCGYHPSARLYFCQAKKVHGKECTNDADCLSEKCANRHCGCSDDSNCGSTSYCRESTDTCEIKLKYQQKCDRSVQCKSNICNLSIKKCGCKANTDCPKNSYCDTDKNKNICIGKLTYEQPCDHATHCLSNQCNDGRCGCSDNDNCQTRQYCSTNSTCMDLKLSDSAPIIEYYSAKKTYAQACADDDECLSEKCTMDEKCGCWDDNECNGDSYCKTSLKSCEMKLQSQQRCSRPVQCKSNICHSLFGQCGCSATLDCPKESYCSRDKNKNTCIVCPNVVASTWKRCLEKCLENPDKCLADHFCICSRLDGSKYFNWNIRIQDYISKTIENASSSENSTQATQFNEIKYWQPKVAANAEISRNLTLSDFAKFITELDKRGCLDMAWSIVFPTDYIVGINMSSTFNESSKCSPRCTNYKNSNKTDQTCYKDVIYDHNGEIEPTCPKKVNVEICETPRIVTAIPLRNWSKWANVSKCHRESNHPRSKCYRFEGRYRSSDNSGPNALENQEVRERECNEADHRECDLNCTMSIGRPQKCKNLTLNNDVPQCVLTMRKDVIVNATYNGSQCGETAMNFTCTSGSPNLKLCADAIVRLQCFEVFVEERKKFCKTVCRGDTKAARMMKFANDEKCTIYHEYSVLTSSMCHEQNCSIDCRYILDNLVDTLMTSSFQLGNQQCNDMTADPCPVNENYIHTTTVEEGKCIREATDGRMKRDTCSSHWAAWSDCSENCNVGTRSRTMEILHGGICSAVVDSEPCMLNICANHLSGNLCLFLYFNRTEGDKIVTDRIKVSGDDDCIVQQDDHGFARPTFPTMNKLVNTKVNFSPIFINGIIVALLVMMVIVARHIRQSAAATDLEGIPLEDVPVPEEIETTIESATLKLPTCPSVRNVDDQSETMFSRGFTRKSAQSTSIENVTSPPILSDPFKTESVTTLDMDPSTLSRQDSKLPNTGKSIETEEKTQKSTFTSPSIIKITKTWKLDAIIDKTEGTSTVEQKSKDRITPKQTSQANEE